MVYFFSGIFLIISFVIFEFEILLNPLNQRLIGKLFLLL